VFFLTTFYLFYLLEIKVLLNSADILLTEIWPMIKFPFQGVETV